MRINQLILGALLTIGIGPAQAAGAVEAWSGGTGSEEREYLLSQSADASLKLEFATPSGDYLSNVRVTIRDTGGTVLVDMRTDGPLFFARLAPGRYQLVAGTDTGGSQTQDIQIGARSRTALVLRFRE